MNLDSDDIGGLDNHLDRMQVRQYKFDQINIENELADAYSELVTLRSMVNSMPESVPANQIAGVNTAVVNILKEIHKMRNELYDANLVKMLEGAVHFALEDAPDDVKHRFFEKMREYKEKKQ